MTLSPGTRHGCSCGSSFTATSDGLGWQCAQNGQDQRPRVERPREVVPGQAHCWGALLRAVKGDMIFKV